jgi:hypothetical protein
MTDDAITIASLLGGGGAAALMLKVLWGAFVARANDAERKRTENAEERATRQESRMESLQTALTQIQGQLSVISTSAAFSAAEFRRLDERQEGMSANYGARLARVEADIVRIETTLSIAKRSA